MIEVQKTNNEYVPLRDIVFDKLRENIITGRLKPGDRLMEIKLANEMGVSRTPVREAIKKLEDEGLVIMNARRGAMVAPINERVMRELLEVRKALEALASHLVAVKASEEDILKLREINKEIEAAVKAEDIKTITEQDVYFHEMISHLADNSHLTSMLDQIKEHLFRYRLEFIKATKNRQLLVEEHEKIITAFETHNPKMAEREMEKHIELQEKFILNYVAHMKKI